MRLVSRQKRYFYMATAAGAQCMGLADCDSLSVGKKRDIIMIDLMQPNMQPENDIAKSIY